jgi:hypothetical protein
MALTMITKDSAAVQAVVLRPICIGGERVEVDTVVTLTANQYAELRAAAKVGPAPVKAAAKAAKAVAPKSATQADTAAPSEAAAS